MLLNCGVGEDSSNQSILKEISPEYSLEGWMLKLKLQYFGLLMWRTDWEKPWCWERLKAGGEGDNRGWMVGWHHQLNGHEFEQSPGVADGQGSLSWFSPWSHRVRYDWVTELHWTDAVYIIARTGKQSGCPLSDEWIKKLWYIYTMEYYSAIKGMHLSPF